MAEKNKGGRPPTYKEDYARQAYVACKNSGCTDPELAELFNVSRTSINNWKNEHPEFLDAIKRGKDEFDVATAENCLKKRIEGYEYQEAKVVEVDGVVTRKEVTKKHIAPDVGALCFFLKNRNPERWRDKQDFLLSGDKDNPVALKWQVEIVKPKDEDA